MGRLLEFDEAVPEIDEVVPGVNRSVRRFVGVVWSLIGGLPEMSQTISGG
jgi:hypothetical protein